MQPDKTASRTPLHHTFACVLSAVPILCIVVVFFFAATLLLILFMQFAPVPNYPPLELTIRILTCSAAGIAISVIAGIIYVLHNKKKMMNSVSGIPSDPHGCLTIPTVLTKRISSQTWPIASVAVLFADLKDYTILTNELGDEQAVAVLHRLYCEFDTCSMMFGITKIKTNGDEYMAVAGLTHTGHANPMALSNENRCLAFACALLTITRALGKDCQRGLSIKIGIATGPVTAGFIGRYECQFDVWGKTVNQASLLQRMASDNTIAVCNTTAKGLRHRECVNVFTL